MLVDIAVPRNVAEDCKKIPNVQAYNVDDLKAIVANNTAMRQKEMIEAEERANNFREEELKKCTCKLANSNLSDKELKAVERLSHGIVNKLLHGPMAHLRKSESVEQNQAAVKELSSMFRLEDEDTPNGRSRRL
eukprot:scaffold63769_cov32-Attheya_sp.AAC.6